MLRRVGLTPALGAGGEAAVHPTPSLAGDRTSYAWVPVTAPCAAEGAQVLGQDLIRRVVHVVIVPDPIEVSTLALTRQGPKRDTVDSLCAIAAIHPVPYSCLTELGPMNRADLSAKPSDLCSN